MIQGPIMGLIKGGGKELCASNYDGLRRSRFKGSCPFFLRLPFLAKESLFVLWPDSIFIAWRLPSLSKS